VVVIRKYIIQVFYFLSLIFVKELNFLHYNSTDSPDFAEYFRYFEYNIGILEYSTREQGLFYYYLNSWYFYLNNFPLSAENFYIYLNRSIQELNFIFFLIGSLGFYFLLKSYNFSKNTIYLSLLALNFFPVVLALRLIFKPEIMAFSFLPWIIFYLEKFKLTKKFKYLLLAIPLAVISVAAKGSIFVCFGLFFLIFYFKNLIISNKKFVTIFLLIGLMLFLLISFEDSRNNGRNLLDIESGSTSRENYDYKAPLETVYKINLFNLVTSPIQHNHADSFLSITLLDTFGDYFNLYWNNDSSNYLKNRKEVINYQVSNEIKSPEISNKDLSLTVFFQKDTDIYLRQSLGLVASLVFYLLILKKIIKRKKYNKFLLSPFVGMAAVLFHAISGFPVNNYDPFVGDTFKTLYSSFFIALCFVFLCANIFKKGRLNSLKIFTYILLVIFLIGFPKENNSEYQTMISQTNNYSSLCKINKTYLKIVTNNNNEYLNCEISERVDIKLYNPYEKHEAYSNKPKFGFTNLILGVGAFLSLLFNIYENFYMLKRRK